MEIGFSAFSGVFQGDSRVIRNSGGFFHDCHLFLKTGDEELTEEQQDIEGATFYKKELDAKAKL